MMTDSSRLALVALWWLAASCSVTETGNPPLVDTDRIGPSDVTELGFVTLLGEEAVEPPGGTVYLANLDRPGVAIAEVNDSGSFSVTAMAEAGDRLRLQVLDSVGRLSEPVDFVGPTDEQPRLLPFPGSACISLSSAALELRVANDCARVVAITARVSQITGAVTPMALSLPAGSSATLAVVGEGPVFAAVEDDEGGLEAATLRAE